MLLGGDKRLASFQFQMETYLKRNQFQNDREIWEQATREPY